MMPLLYLLEDHDVRISRGLGGRSQCRSAVFRMFTQAEMRHLAVWPVQFSLVT